MHNSKVHPIAAQAAGELTYCEEINAALEAAKKHAYEGICDKEPQCCKKVKIELWCYKSAMKVCPETCKARYVGFVVDCDAGTIEEAVREGDY